MTLALALVLLGVLMLYCAIKGRSLARALTGRAEAGASGSVLPA